MLNLVLSFFAVCFSICFLANCEARTSNNKKYISDVKNESDRKKMEEKVDNKKMPMLQTEMSLQQGKLKIKYKVINSTKKDIYLFNKLWEWDQQGKYVPAATPAFSALMEPETLHVGKQIAALPKSKRVEMKQIPFVAKVSAGEDFQEEFEIKVPVDEYNPYFLKAENSEVELIKAKSLMFSTQFIFESTDLEIKDSPLQDSFAVWHPKLAELVETLSSKPVPLEIDVNKRLDNFESF